MVKRPHYALGRALKRAFKSAQKNEKGQSLAELPYVVLLTCLLVLMLIQPVIFLYTQMALGQVASGICRIVATEDSTLSGSKETLIRSYATDKLEGLPKGDAFRVPGTLRVDVSGNAKSERIEVTVSVKQKPLPLVGFLFTAATGTKAGADIEVSGRAATRGAQVGVEGSPKDAPQHFGNPLSQR